MKGICKDWFGLDTDPLLRAIAIEDAKSGDTEAARQLLKIFARGLRKGQVDLALLSYVADAMDAIADSEKPGETAAKALNLQRPQRGRPRSKHTPDKHLRAATDVAKLRLLGMTPSAASQIVSETVHMEPNRVRDAYKNATASEIAIQIAMDCCDAAGRLKTAEPP